MTAIAAIAWDTGALLVGDSWWTDEHGCASRGKLPKVVARHHFLLGVSGDAAFCVAALLDSRSGVESPKYDRSGLMAWAYESFVPWLQSRTEKGQGTCVLASVGELVCVSEDYSVTEFGDGYGAIGNAMHLLTGALAVSRKLAPIARARLVMSAASYHNLSAPSPWDYVAIDTERYDAGRL